MLEDGFLKGVLGAEDVSLFFSRDWGKNMRVLHAALSPFPEPMVSVEEFERALQTLNRAHEGWLHLADKRLLAVPVDFVRSNGLLDMSRVAAAFRTGQTLYFTKAELVMPPLTRACRVLGNELHASGISLRRKLDAHIFLTPARSLGFALHRDGHARIIWQCEGQKTWEIYKPNDGLPTRAFSPGAVSSEELDCCTKTDVLLEAGDVLYIPEWWPHIAKSRGHHSLHVTFRIFPLRYCDVVERLVARSGELSAALPPHFGRASYLLADLFERLRSKEFDNEFVNGVAVAWRMRLMQTILWRKERCRKQLTLPWRLMREGRRMAKTILGIASSHDGAACLLQDGEIQSAIREERLSGVKRQRIYAGRSSLAVRYCLASAGISSLDLTSVAVATQRSAAALENDINLTPDLRDNPVLPRRIVSHHLAHAASAVALSGFESCAVLVCDGLGSPLSEVTYGDDTRIFGPRDGSEHLTLYHADGPRIRPLEIHTCLNWITKRETGLWHFDSLGGMYAAISQDIFGRPDEAGKVMGLAPYGVPIFDPDEFLVFREGHITFSNAVPKGYQRLREQHDDRNVFQANLAASVQQALEATLIRLVRHLRDTTDESRLCLAGGVALNCSANQRILEETGFNEIFIVPAADDAGTAIGAAYLEHWDRFGPTQVKRVRSDALGHPVEQRDIQAAIKRVPGIEAERPDDLFDAVATRLARGEIGCWMEGGAEFGPRSLGQRSIVASPTFSDMKDWINAGVKFREAFRPFAPAIPAAIATEWFDFGVTDPVSPFMLRAVPIRRQAAKAIPAVTHVDGTGRLQTLTAEDNPGFHSLVQRLSSKTGVPVLLNTSLNLKDEPIAETADDAIWTMLGTTMTFCVIGDHLVSKRSDFHSVLDLFPCVTATEWTVRLPVHNGRLERQSNVEEAVKISVETPWGATEVAVPPRLMPLLSSIDGVSDGHSLREKVSATHQAMVHDLLLLRRMHVISLEERLR